MEKRRVVWSALATIALVIAVRGEAAVVAEKAKHAVKRVDPIVANEQAAIDRLHRAAKGQALFALSEQVETTMNGPEFVSDGYRFIAFPLHLGSIPEDISRQLDLRKVLAENYFVFAWPDTRSTGSRAFVVDQTGAIASNCASGYAGKGTINACCSACGELARNRRSVAGMIGASATVHGREKWEPLASPVLIQ